MRLPPLRLTLAVHKTLACGAVENRLLFERRVSSLLSRKAAGIYIGIYVVEAPLPHSKSFTAQLETLLNFSLILPFFTPKELMNMR